MKLRREDSTHIYSQMVWIVFLMGKVGMHGCVALLLILVLSEHSKKHTTNKGGIPLKKR